MATKGSKIQTLIDKTLHTQKKPNDSATRTQKQEDRGKKFVFLGRVRFSSLLVTRVVLLVNYKSNM
jgi:hypothetical protein